MKARFGPVWSRPQAETWLGAFAPAARRSAATSDRASPPNLRPRSAATPATARFRHQARTACTRGNERYGTLGAALRLSVRLPAIPRDELCDTLGKRSVRSETQQPSGLGCIGVAD